MSKNFELLLQAQQENRRADSSPVAGRNKDGWNVTAAPAEMPIPLPGPGAVREQISMLVRRLFLLPEGVRAAVLAGVESGDGNSWITMECARTLAASVPGPVCVVDGNLHTPALHRYFGVPSRRGLRDAAFQGANICEFAEPLPKFRNLWLMTAGTVTAKGTEAAALEQLCSRMADLRAKFDYLLIDGPPLHFCGDAIMLGRAADGVALVLAEQSTHRERARYAVQELTKANVRILGVVLNKRTFPIPQKIYDKI